MRKFLAVTAFCIVLTGCGGKPNSNMGSTPSVDVDATVDQLKDTVGNPDHVKISAKLSPEQALTAASDYHTSTGKWFEGNGFNLLTSYTSEVAEAGSDVGAGISTIPDGSSVRFQITSRDKDGKRIELITEYVGIIKIRLMDDFTFHTKSRNFRTLTISLA